MGEGSFRYSMYLSPQVPGSFPYILLIAGYFPTLVGVDTTGLNTPGLKMSPPQVYVHIQNNGHNQSIPTNGHPQVNIGHSGHALNSEHAFRGS